MRALGKQFCGFFDAERVEIEVAPGPAQVRAALLAEHLTLSTPLEARLREPSESSRGDGARVLVGSLTDQKLRELAGRCGVEALGDGGFRVLGREFREASAAFVAAFADPARDDVPLVLVLGNDVELLNAYMRSIPRPWKPFLRVYSEGELELTCPLRADGTPRAELAIDLGERFRSHWADSKVVEAKGFKVHAKAALDWESWQRYLTDVFEANAKMSESWPAPGCARSVFTITSAPS